MTELQDKLRRLYESGTKTPVGHSWIPKRPYGDDPWEQLRKRMVNDESNNRQNVSYGAEELNEAKGSIFKHVEDFLKDEYGEETLETKMAHFLDSWDKLYEKYGDLLIVALKELTDEMKFLNHDGYVNKVVARRMVKEVKTKKSRD